MPQDSRLGNTDSTSLKQTNKKMIYYTQVSNNKNLRTTADFSSEIMDARRQKNYIFKLLKKLSDSIYINKFLKMGKYLYCVRSHDNGYPSESNDLKWREGGFRGY